MRFWEVARKAEPYHRQYLDHLLACPLCRASVGRLCDEARRLKGRYEAAMDHFSGAVDTSGRKS
jgi:hypothetical protein